MLNDRQVPDPALPHPPQRLFGAVGKLAGAKIRGHDFVYRHRGRTLGMCRHGAADIHNRYHAEQPLVGIADQREALVLPGEQPCRRSDRFLRSDDDRLDALFLQELFDIHDTLLRPASANSWRIA